MALRLPRSPSLMLSEGEASLRSRSRSASAKLSDEEDSSEAALTLGSARCSPAGSPRPSSDKLSDVEDSGGGRRLGRGGGGARRVCELQRSTVADCPLVPFGCKHAGEFIALPKPSLSKCPGLHMVVRSVVETWQVPRRARCSAPLVPCGEDVVVQWYGTPRLFPCSQITSPFLTRRNCRELPTILHFDTRHRAEVGVDEWQKRVVASPTVVEWLMGVPRGWTATPPLCQEVLQLHALQASAAGVSAAARRAKQHPTLSLFSGCGALDFGLLSWCRPVAYCESCEAAVGVLKARMSDGTLPVAPVHTDVRNLLAVRLRGKVEGIVMGFPCQDISFAGNQQGFLGERSSLVFEGLRLADETQCAFIFMENVSNLSRMPQVWKPLFDALEGRGFTIMWVILGACHVGSPQRRSRWFALARRDGHKSPPLSLQHDRLPTFEAQSGLNFNGGRPPATKWLVPKKEHSSVADRLDMLGNAVVPLQAHLAATLLDL